MARDVNANFYVVLGVGANALWGAAFIVPYALHDFPSELITIFRYLVYGVTSIVVLMLLGLGNVKISLPISWWEMQSHSVAMRVIIFS